MKLIPTGKGKPKLHLQVTDDFSVEIVSACWHKMTFISVTNEASLIYTSVCVDVM